MRDPYQVLGVSRSADAKEIKGAFRKLARENHPDLHPGDAKAEARFKEVNAAYDLLGDKDKRAAFDRGEIDVDGQPTAQRTFYRRYADGGAGAKYNDFSGMFRDQGAGETFWDLFGGGTRSGARVRTKGSDVRYRLDVNFIGAVKGGRREVTLPDGRRLNVTVPAGTEDGHVLRLKGQGLPGTGGGANGDALVEIHVAPDPVFTRRGDTIEVDLPVTLGEAVLGARVEVPTVDGPVTMTVPKGSNSGNRLRLRGKGVPHAKGGGRGDQLVVLRIVLPDKPDEALTRFAEQWSKDRPYKVRDRKGGAA